MRTYDVMIRNVISVRPDTPLKEVARLLSDHGIGGVPVTDENGLVLGVVSESDFLVKEKGRDYVRQSRLARLLGQPNPDVAKVIARTAGEAMTTPAVTIDSKSASVRYAARVMSDCGINRLPVTESGLLVGIITRGDIVRLYAQPDPILEKRVHDALRAIDGLIVEGVKDGVVTLGGTVATRALVDAAVDVAGAVDGVVGVNADQLASIPCPPTRHVPLSSGLCKLSECLGIGRPFGERG